MNKTRNVAPTNMDSLFDAAPYEKTPLSELPIGMQAQIICGCGFLVLNAAAVDNGQTETETAALSFEDGPSVSLKKRARNLINANFEISNRNKAGGRAKQNNTTYGDPVKRYKEADQAAKLYFEKAFGMDELIVSGMSTVDAQTMADEAWSDYNKKIGGTGPIADERKELTEAQQKIIENLRD